MATQKKAVHLWAQERMQNSSSCHNQPKSSRRATAKMNKAERLNLEEIRYDWYFFLTTLKKMNETQWFLKISDGLR